MIHRDVDGTVLIWSNDFVDRELEIFMRERPALTAPFLYCLLGMGANITSIVDIDDIDSIKPIRSGSKSGLWPKAAQGKS